MIIEDYFAIDGTYELVDGLYNVDGDVELIELVEKLPCKFFIVTGSFWCFNNNLTSLKGAPTQIGGSFKCYKNLRKTKEYRQYLIFKKLRSW